MAMITTSLINADFFAFVGLYDEEYKIPNKIRINISIGKNSDVANIPMIDYSILFDMTRNVLCSKHHPLLEDILKELHNAIKNKWEYDKLSISIEKLNPPTGSNVQSSKIVWEE